MPWITENEALQDGDGSSGMLWLHNPTYLVCNCKYFVYVARKIHPEIN